MRQGSNAEMAKRGDASDHRSPGWPVNGGPETRLETPEMTEPWDFTEAQRRQFREAHAEAKRKSVDELLHDPRSESEADREEVRERRSVAEHKCPRCHIARLNRCRSDDGTLLDRPHPERVRLVKEA